MVNSKLIVVAAIVLLGGSFLLYRMNTDTTTETVEPAAIETIQPAATITITSPAPTPVAIVNPQPSTPVIVEVMPVEPVEEPELAEPLVDVDVVEPLPSLNTSDSLVRTQISSFKTGPELLSLMVSDQLIRRFVLFTDSVSRNSLSRDIPLQPMRNAMQISSDQNEESFVMKPESYDRFNSLTEILINIDTGEALSFYKTLSPLFQEAYAEIGYPEQSFDNAMLTAIENVLSATEAEGPFDLIRPSVMYRYAHEDIEALNSVEKQLLRLGPMNAEKLKQKLYDFRVRFLAN